MRKFLQNDLRALGVPPTPWSLPESPEEEPTEKLLLRYHQPQNCRILFDAWEPIVTALNRHYRTNLHQYAEFISFMNEVGRITLPIFNRDLHYGEEPIAYCAFLMNNTVPPTCNPNAVLVPVLDPVHGPILQLKAVKPLQAGELVNYKRYYSRFEFKTEGNGCFLDVLCCRE